jgi:hypothetical protein
MTDLQTWIEATTKTLEEHVDDRNSCCIAVESREQANALRRIVNEKKYLIQFWDKNTAIVDTHSILIPFDAFD